MKRIIALLLALLMMMSSMIITSYAEVEAEAENDEIISEVTGDEEAEEAGEELFASEPEEEADEEEEDLSEEPEEEPEEDEEPAEAEEEPEEAEEESEEEAEEAEAEEESEEDEEPAEAEEEPEEDEETAEAEEEPEEEEEPAEAEEKPEAEEEPETEPETVDEEEEIPFTEGYVLLKKNTAVYEETNGRKIGTITADSYAYAVSENEAGWLFVVFEADDALLEGFVRADRAVILSEAESAVLANDTEAGEYQGHRIPAAAYAAEAAASAETAEQKPEAKPEFSVNCTPAVLKAKIGDTARFYATVTDYAKDAAYQWQYSADEGKTWADIAGQTKSMLSFKVTDSNSDHLYRCKAQVKDVSRISSEVSLEIRTPVADNSIESNAKTTVTITPKKVSALLGKKVSFLATVKNPGKTVTYQWQYSADKGKTWKNASFTGSKTKKLTVKVSKKTAKYRYRCVVKTKGKKVISKSVLIYGIKAYASSSKIDIGKTAKFTVKIYTAGSKSASYQWYYSTDKGTTWKESSKTGNKTATLSIKTTAANVNNWYRCRVITSTGRITTNEVYVAPNPRYYALIIANSDYDYCNDLPGVYKDGTAVKRALTNLGWNVKLVRNATYSKINSSIRSYFKGKLSTDVCMFYYTGHGDDSYNSSAGALVGVDFSGSVAQLYYPYELRNALLETTKGKVTIMLDSCGSGAGIYDNDEKAGKASNFTNGVMNAFNGYLDNGNELESNTGELLQDRFAVLAACEYGTTSQDGYYCMVNGELTYRRGGTFTYSVLRAVGCGYPSGKYSGKLTGDTNKDKKLTLKEAYKSVKSTVNKMNDMLEDNNYVAYYEGDSNNPAGYYYFYTLDQSVQMGGNGNTVLFIQK